MILVKKHFQSFSKHFHWDQKKEKMVFELHLKLCTFLKLDVVKTRRLIKNQKNKPQWLFCKLQPSFKTKLIAYVLSTLYLQNYNEYSGEKRITIKELLMVRDESADLQISGFHAQ